MSSRGELAPAPRMTYHFGMTLRATYAEELAKSVKGHRTRMNELLRNPGNVTKADREEAMAIAAAIEAECAILAAVRGPGPGGTGWDD